MKKGFKTIVEMGEARIKCLQAKADAESWQVVSGRAEALAARGDAEISRRLALLGNVDPQVKTGETILVIPRKKALVKQLVLPTQESDEIQNIISLQIPQLGPYSKDEVVFDYQVLDKSKDGTAKVLVTLVPREIVDRGIRIIEQSGLHASGVLLSSLAIKEWFFKNYPQEQEAVALIVFAEENAEICFFQKQQFLFSRAVSFNASDPEANVVAELVEQFGLTEGLHKKEKMGSGICKIYLAADSKETLLKSELERYHPFPVVMVTAHQPRPSVPPAMPSLASREASWAACLGALMMEDRAVGLLPEDFQSRKYDQQRRKLLWKCVLALAVVFTLIVVSKGVTIYKNFSCLNELQQKVLKQNNTLQGTEKNIQLADFLRDIFSGRLIVADLITKLYDLTPEDVTYRSLSLETGGNLSLEGFVSEAGSIQGFQKRLLKSDVFDDVNLLYATKRRRFNEEYTEFKMVCHLAKKREVSRND